MAMGEAKYQLLMVVELAPGYLAVGPPAGFADRTVVHLLKLRCTTCGELTTKDVGLYVPPPNNPPCSLLFGADVTKRCYRTCVSGLGSHLVRKCKMCDRTGSVEILPATGAYAAGGAGGNLKLTCRGYTLVEYNPGPGWAATTTGGDLVPVKFIDGWFQRDGDLVAEVHFLFEE